MAFDTIQRPKIADFLSSKDVDLDAGIDFVHAIGESVGSCDVLIAVIGKGWLTSRDQEGQRRLDDPEDFVRIEIVTALQRPQSASWNFSPARSTRNLMRCFAWPNPGTPSSERFSLCDFGIYFALFLVR
jgi:hypothetical protein